VRSIVFARDGHLVLSLSKFDVVVRETGTGRQLAHLHSDTNLVCMAVSPDRRTLATGDGQNRIRLWELTSGRELAYWTAHEAPVSALAFAPDGRTLVSGGTDGAIRLWNLPGLRRQLAAWGLSW
jgi:WD40 repeat protein